MISKVFPTQLYLYQSEVPKPFRTTTPPSEAGLPCGCVFMHAHPRAQGAKTRVSMAASAWACRQRDLEERMG